MFSVSIHSEKVFQNLNFFLKKLHFWSALKFFLQNIRNSPADLHFIWPHSQSLLRTVTSQTLNFIVNSLSLSNDHDPQQQLSKQKFTFLNCQALGSSSQTTSYKCHMSRADRCKTENLFAFQKITREKSHKLLGCVTSLWSAPSWTGNCKSLSCVKFVSSLQEVRHWIKFL